MADYTGIEDITDMVMTASNRVEFGDDEPDPGTNTIDMSYAQVDNLRRRVESSMTQRLARFYTTPLNLTDEDTAMIINDIATKLVAFQVYSVLHQNMSSDELPAVVEEWRRDAEEKMNQIIPIGKSQAKAGRDVILEGETLKTGAGDATTANIAFTNKLSHGGTTS